MRSNRPAAPAFSGSDRAILAAVFMGAALGTPATADTLEQALAAAYDHHPSLKAERMRVQEVDENYVQAQAQGRLQISASGSAGITDAIVSSTNFLGRETESQNQFYPRSFSITGQQPLYQGGRVRSLKGQAKYGILSARESLRDAEQNILLSAATAYADVIRDEAIAGIRRNNVRVLMRQGEAARDRFDVGVGTRTDIAQADARLAGAEIGLASANAALESSRSAYLRATGTLPLQLAPTPQFKLPPSAQQAAEMAVTYNPQLEAARYAADAAKFGIDVAKSTGRPTISLQSFVQTSVEPTSAVLGQDSVGLSANVTIPIMTGGLVQSRVRQASAAQNRAKFEVRNVEDAVRDRVTALWAQLEAARSALASSKRQVDAAQIAFEGVEIEQQVGTRDALDVLNAEQEVLNAKLSVAQAQRDLDVITFQVLVLSGAFDALSLGLPVALYDPKDNFEEVSIYKPLAPVKQMIDDLPFDAPEVLKGAVQKLPRIVNRPQNESTVPNP